VDVFLGTQCIFVHFNHPITDRLDSIYSAVGHVGHDHGKVNCQFRCVSIQVMCIYGVS